MGLIGDLEYAKHSNDHPLHPVRIVCLLFLHSLDLTYHLSLDRVLPRLWPMRHWSTNTTSSQFPRLRMRIWVQPHLFSIWILLKTALDVVVTTRPPFIFHPCHDMESIWWILVWVLLFRDAKLPSPDPVRRQYMMYKLFNGNLENNSRLPFFLQPDTANYLPPCFCFLLRLVKLFSQHLWNAYCHVEKNYPIINPLADTNLYVALVELFSKKILDEARNVTLIPVKQRHRL